MPALVREGFRVYEEQQADTAQVRANAAEIALRRTIAFPAQYRAIRMAATNKQSAIVTSRRSGKSDGVMRWVFARMVRRDNYVVRVIASVLAAPTENFLAPADKPGFLDLMATTGIAPYAKVKTLDGNIKKITFIWGSTLIVEDVGSMRAITRKRGFSADLYWCDEAQDVVLLGPVLKKLVRPTLADSRAQLVLTGTPGMDVDSLFYAACHDSNLWAVARFYSWQNPHFGSTDAERWARIVDDVIEPGRDEYALSDDDLARIRALTENGREQISRGTETGELAEWVDKGLDADLLREVFGRWIFGGKAYVYRWHEAPNLYWARVSPSMYAVDESLPVLADDLDDRIEQLPKLWVQGRQVAQQWSAVVCADPGTETGPSGSGFDVVVWSDTHTAALVLWSENQEEFHITEVVRHCADLAEILVAGGVRVMYVVGDFISTGVSERQWHEDFAARLPSTILFRTPKKSSKAEQIKVVNMDLMATRLQAISGDVLDLEGRNLRYKPFDASKKILSAKPTIDKWRLVTLPTQQTRRLGDHVLDALRYGLQFVGPLPDEAPEPEYRELTPVERELQRLRQMRP